jgi:hypothetical protein
VKSAITVGLLILAGSEAFGQDTAMVQGGIYQRPFLVSIGRTSLGGYADANVSWFVTDGVSEGWNAEMARFNVFFAASAGRRLRFLAELEFEHGTEEIVLETALLDFVITPSLVLRGGVILPPIGAFNVGHDSPRYDFVDRPLVSTTIIPTTLSEAGIGVHGRLAPGRVSISYDAYLTNGLDDGVIENEAGRTSLPAGKGPERFAEDNNGSPSFSGRVAAQSRTWGEVGLSYYGGLYNTYRVDGQAVDEKRGLGLLAVDLTTAFKTIVARGEVAFARVEVPDDLRGVHGERQWGFYLDLVAPVWRPRIRGLERPVVDLGLRLERVDFNHGSLPGTGDKAWDETNAFTAALAFRPTAETVFKLNYRYESSRDLLGNPAVQTGGIQLGFATYF